MDESSNPDNSPFQSPTKPSTEPVRRTRWGDYIPGPFSTLIFLLCAAGAIAANVTGIRGDRAEVNVATGAAIFVSALTLLLWFVFRSRYAAKLRFGFLAIVLLAVVAFAGSFRVDQFSGEMIPQFRFRWRPAPDKQLGQVRVQSGLVDLATTTPLDFPQYLGPDRTGKVNTIHLAENWAQQPPKQIWKQPIGAGWSAFSAVNGFAVTMEQRGEDELVTCYEVHTGKPRWANALHARHETVLGGVGPRSTPTIYQGKVYALGATGILRCLNGANGDLIWKHDLLKEFGVGPNEDGKYVAWGRSNSPLVVDDLVVVPAGGAPDSRRSLVAFDCESGEKVWAAGESQVSYSSPIVAEINGQRQIVSVNENTVTGHNIQDGKVLWSFDWPGSSVQAANTSQPLVYQNSVIATKGYSQGCVRFEIQGSSVSKVFENSRALRTKLTSAVLQDNYAYALSDGILECVDVKDGTRKWKGGRFGHGQILLVNDHLLVLSETGDLVLVSANPDAFRQLGRTTALEGKSWNNLCLFGRFLLIRNGEEAACYELPVLEDASA